MQFNWCMCNATTALVVWSHVFWSSSGILIAIHYEHNTSTCSTLKNPYMLARASSFLSTRPSPPTTVTQPETSTIAAKLISACLVDDIHKVVIFEATKDAFINSIKTIHQPTQQPQLWDSWPILLHINLERWRFAMMRYCIELAR